MSNDNNKVNYTISIDKDLRNRFKVYCAVKGKFQNEVLEELITKLLENNGKYEGVGEGDGYTNK